MMAGGRGGEGWRKRRARGKRGKRRMLFKGEEGQLREGRGMREEGAKGGLERPRWRRGEVDRGREDGRRRC